MLFQVLTPVIICTAVSNEDRWKMKPPIYRPHNRSVDMRLLCLTHLIIPVIGNEQAVIEFIKALNTTASWDDKLSLVFIINSAINDLQLEGRLSHAIPPAFKDACIEKVQFKYTKFPPESAVYQIPEAILSLQLGLGEAYYVLYAVPSIRINIDEIAANVLWPHRPLFWIMSLAGHSAIYNMVDREFADLYAAKVRPLRQVDPNYRNGTICQNMKKHLAHDDTLQQYFLVY